VNIRNTASRALLPLAIAALPLVLLYSSIQTFKELDEQRSVFLRHRVSLLAARLENLPAEATPDQVWESLSEAEPSLRDLAILSEGDKEGAGLDALWNHQELFRTEYRSAHAGGVFRAYVPFHSSQGLRIARIDLDPAAADFLLLHARHNVIVSFLGGLALVVVSAYSVWSMRRAGKMRVRQLEMEHLAHMGKMAAILAHEIRNPLGTIKGFVQLAGERADAATQQVLKPAIAETERLERLVRELLAYARPPAPAPVMVEWNAVAATLSAHGRQLIGERRISLNIPASPLVWQTDPALLEQILLNLLRNAIEAIPPATPGAVTMEVDTGTRDVIISVIDTGSGFSEAATERMFEPFFTTKAAGTGLGLAITRGLVSALGGRLEIRRGSVGGTAAVIRLPMAMAPEMAVRN
jgi:signal transduction histidine kinase